MRAPRRHGTAHDLRHETTCGHRASAYAARRARVAEAGGQMLSAAFAFLNEMLPDQPQDAANAATTQAIRDSLGQCLQTDDSGKPVLTVTLPNTEALDRLAQTLANLIPRAE